MITVVDFEDQTFAPTEFSLREFGTFKADADERGVTVTDLMKDAMLQLVLRRKGKIIYFPTYTDDPDADTEE